MSLVEKINKQHVIYFIIAIVHFLVVFLNTPSFEVCISTEQKVNYVIIKSVSFILIVALWQFIKFIIDTLKSSQIDSVGGKKEQVLFVKWFLFYFILNIIVLCMTFPVMIYGSPMVYELPAIENYFIIPHPNWYQFANDVIAYNILPFPFAPSICNSFLYSLIFSYCISSIECFYGKKRYLFLLFVFCFPWVLVSNQDPSRAILVSWLFILVVMFIFFNQNKQNNSIPQFFLFSIISGLLVSIKSEYICLLVIIPIIVFIYKIFTKKTFSFFLILFLSLFLFCSSIQKKLEGCNYEIHNLSFVYEYYIDDEMYDPEIEKNKELFMKIYGNRYKCEIFRENGNISKEEASSTIKLLIKFVLKNPYHFINKNISYFINLHDEIFGFTDAENFARTYSAEIAQVDELSNFLIPEYKIKHKLCSLLLYFNLNNKSNIFSKMIYNPVVSCFLLFVSVLIAIFTKRYFAIWVVFAWILIIIPVLLFIKWHFYIYFHSFILNSWVMFALSIILLLEKLEKRTEN